MVYLIQVTACWAILYLLYWLLYRNETFFKVNRIYLLTTIIVGLLLPYDWASIWFRPKIETELPIVFLETVFITATSIKQGVEKVSFDYYSWFKTLYLIGVLMMSFRLLYGLSRIFWMIHFFPKIKQNDYILLKTNELHLPYSFGKYIFWSEKFSLESETGQTILKHELAHVQQKHTFDVVFLEILNIFFWCSPMIYIYKKSIRAVHEYLADQAVVHVESKQKYGSILLAQAKSGPTFALANHFISSQLKLRFIMLIKNQSSRWAYLKYALFLPILIAVSCSMHEEIKISEPLQKDFEVRTSVDTIITFNPETLAEKVQIVVNTDTVYNNVDKVPEFIGGQSAMMNFISTNLKYPKEARESGIQGKALACFTVARDGYVFNISIKKSSGDKNLDKATIETIQAFNQENTNKITTWKPAIKNGKPVKCDVILPIAFRLDK